MGLYFPGQTPAKYYKTVSQQQNISNFQNVNKIKTVPMSCQNN